MGVFQKSWGYIQTYMMMMMIFGGVRRWRIFSTSKEARVCLWLLSVKRELATIILEKVSSVP